MMKLEKSYCKCNDYEKFYETYAFCDAKCGKNHKKTVEDDRSGCCLADCLLLDNYMVVDGKINKTAMATFYGKVGDSKIAENIEECKTIG